MAERYAVQISTGQFVRLKEVRDPQYAFPGWYPVVEVFSATAWILPEDAQHFIDRLSLKEKARHLPAIVRLSIVVTQTPNQRIGAAALRADLAQKSLQEGK